MNKVFVEKCPEDNHVYKYIITDNKVIAISTFAKRPVRGVAICDSSDTFNLETGKKLARLRCTEKIAQKRVKQAEREYNYFKWLTQYQQQFFDKACVYYTDSTKKYTAAKQQTEDFIKTI